MSKDWFILQYKPNSQHIARKNLDRQGYETFLPLFNNTTRKVSRFVKTKQPLFPGYMFIAFNRTNSNWHKINNTYGVARLLTFNSTLKSLPATFINNLMERYDSSGKLLPIKKLTKGDQIKFLKGPFASFVATVEKYEDDQRIWVLMDLMGRKSKIQTATDCLQLTN
jgi:transcriptional antiterminator RfaH